jgi:hypothetical protein
VNDCPGVVNFGISKCVLCETFGYTWAVFQIAVVATGVLLGGERYPNAADKHFLDILRQGLAKEFPNPERIGCPGDTLLKGIAERRVPLTEAEPWLDHLGSCSPCFQQFTEFRKVVRQRRRVQIWLAVAAILLFSVGGWLWVRTRTSVVGTDIAVLDLRERSVTRGQSPSEVGQAPLAIPRTAKHLILDLPIGSKDGPYDIGLLTEAGDLILRATGVAQLQNHVTDLHVDVDLGSVRPGTYSLAVRQLSLEWTRYPIRVF